MGRFLRIVISATAVAGFVMAGPQIGFADELSDLKKMVKELSDKVVSLEKRVSEYEERENNMQVSKVKDSETSEPAMPEVFNGIDIGLGMTGIMQFTHNANGDDLDQNGEDIKDATWSLDLELSKGFGDYGSAYMLLEAGQGAGVDEELKIFSPVNFDATGGDAGIEVLEGWYEHHAGDAAITFGKLDGTIYIDTNEYANDEAGQFLGNMFRNNPTVEFPDNGAGVRLAFAPSQSVEFDSVVMDGDGDWEDIVDGAFFAAQVNIKPGLFSRNGNYRFYGWKSDQDHIKFHDMDSAQNQSYGFGLSFDQEITDHAGIFTRYGRQNPEVFLDGTDVTLENAYSVGFQLMGELWGRENDVFGLAFGQAFPSDDYKEVNSGFKADAESHIEAYYSYMVNDHLAVSPIVHVIMDPYGNDAVNGDKTIVVGGVRSQVDFLS